MNDSTTLDPSGTTSKRPFTRDITGTLVFLGTGTSHGIPVIGCGCATCRSTNPKNHRTRCSVVLGLPDGNLLIDTPPELRIQLVREKIGLIHSVLFTHNHADHLFGLDDVRIFPVYLGHDIPVYCEPFVEETIRRCFAYAFDPAVQAFPAGGVPKLSFQPVSPGTFKVLGAEIRAFRLLHGPYRSLGFRIGKLAYCTDVKQVPEENIKELVGLEVLILDCLRREPHATHMNLQEALQLIRRVKPKLTYLTHICHRLEHEEISRILPPEVVLAYDGLTIRLPL